MRRIENNSIPRNVMHEDISECDIPSPNNSFNSANLKKNSLWLDNLKKEDLVG